jgi:hypothetical protein
MKYFTEQMAVGRVYSDKSVGGGSSMLRHSMRMLVAVLTFTIGIAIFLGISVDSSSGNRIRRSLL